MRRWSDGIYARLLLQTARRGALLLAMGAAGVLSGCVLGGMEPNDTFVQQFAGTVRRADGAPVAGARVDLWFEEDSMRPPAHTVRTNAAGAYFVEHLSRGRTPDAFVQLLATPPGGSGLARRRVTGLIHDFPRAETQADAGVRVRIDVALDPAS